MKIHIKKLDQFPEVMFLAEINGFIIDNFVEFDKLKKYHGCQLANIVFDYFGTLSSVTASSMELEDAIRDDDEVGICNWKLQDYGSALVDYFVLRDGIFSKRIVNGICIKRLNDDEFQRLSLLLMCLNVRRYYFICPTKPTVDIECISLEHETEFCGEKYNIFKFFDKTGEVKIPRKIFTCRNCGNIFSVSPEQQKFYKSKGLELPKRCIDCRKTKIN